MSVPVSADSVETAHTPLTRPLAPRPHPSGERPPPILAGDLPQHVAIIMDGNRRWARQRDLPGRHGHEAGQQALLDVVHGALELGLRHLTVYAFSTENWRRTPREVAALMRILRSFARLHGPEFGALGVGMRWSGLRNRLWRSVARSLTACVDSTRHNELLMLTLCVDYGGRAEIVAAAAGIARAAAAGRLDPDQVDEAMIARHLHVPDMPDVDLLIRAGGRQRTSNFLPWHATYAELVFSDTLWPDFDRRDLWRAVETYTQRLRTYGADLPGRTSA